VPSNHTTAQGQSQLTPAWQMRSACLLHPWHIARRDGHRQVPHTHVGRARHRPDSRCCLSATSCARQAVAPQTCTLLPDYSKTAELFTRVLGIIHKKGSKRKTYPPWLGRRAPACLLHPWHVTGLDGHRQLLTRTSGRARHWQPLADNHNQLCPARQYITQTVTLLPDTFKTAELLSRVLDIQQKRGGPGIGRRYCISTTSCAQQGSTPQTCTLLPHL
jgi:hypothetical protein